MYDTKLKVLYDENITHTLTVSGTISSDETSSKYLGERITIPIGEKEWDVPFVTISPDTVQNTSTDQNIIEFIMPEEDVSIDVEWRSIYLNIRNSVGTNYVYPNDTLKALTADTPIDLVIPPEVNGKKVEGVEGFTGCKALRSVVMPEGTTCISTDTFSGCTSLKSVSIPDTVTYYIGIGAFSNCPSLTSLHIPDGIKEMGSVCGICTSLKSVRLPRTIPRIEFISFMNCSSLPSIFIPKNITEIQTSAFLGCKKLTSISIENPKGSISGAPAPWDATNASIFWNATTEHGSPFTITSSGEISASDELKSLNENTQVDLVIPSTIDNITSTRVGFQSFRNCSAIISVKLPNGITDIDVGAFQNCTSLISINIPNGVTIIKDSTFDYCPKLESITIPSTVEEIGTQAFNDCTSLKSVTLNEGLKEIGINAFGGCSSLSTLTIPKGVTYIDPNAFQNCTSLTSISVSGAEGSINGAPWGAPNATVNWLG